MSPIAPLASMVTLTMLAACTQPGNARPEPSAAPSVSDACGASKAASYIGAQRTDEVIAQIKSASNARAVRVVGPDDAMTMDYREDRLTITTDGNDRIKTLRCV